MEIQILNVRNRIFGVEHPDTIHAMANLATTHRHLEKYTEAEKLEIEVLDARIGTLRTEPPTLLKL